MSAINKILIRRVFLTREGEEALVKRKDTDKKAMDELVMAHSPMVGKIAKSYIGYGIEFEDLLSCGFVGLQKGAQKYELSESQGARFSTYVSNWITAEITDYIIKNITIMKIVTTAAHKKCFFAIARLRRKYNVSHFTMENATEAAAEIGVSVDDLVDMETRLMRVKSTDAPIKIGGEDTENTLGDTLVSSTPSSEEIYAEREERKVHRRWLKEALETLKPREKDIIIRRRLVDPPDTLLEIGTKYNISRERARQIEMKAFEKIQRYMR